MSHEIPLHQLQPHDFERLCYWIVDEYKNEEGHKRFENTNWLGESGAGEQGRDVITVEIETRKSYVFQCKRVKEFTPGKFESELKKFQGYIQTTPDIKPDVYVLFCSSSITPETIKRGNILAKEIGMEIEYWPKSRIDKLVRTSEFVRDRFWRIIHN